MFSGWRKLTTLWVGGNVYLIWWGAFITVMSLVSRGKLLNGESDRRPTTTLIVGFPQLSAMWHFTTLERLGNVRSKETFSISMLKVLKFWGGGEQILRFLKIKRKAVLSSWFEGPLGHRRLKREEVKCTKKRPLDLEYSVSLRVKKRTKSCSRENW